MKKQGIRNVYSFSLFFLFLFIKVSLGVIFYSADFCFLPLLYIHEKKVQVYPAINSIEFSVPAEVPQKYTVITDNSINWLKTLDESPEIHLAKKTFNFTLRSLDRIFIIPCIPSGIFVFRQVTSPKTRFRKPQKHA